MADFLVRLVREKPLGAGSGIVIVILVVVGIFADVLAPYPYDEPHIRDMMKGPSAQYLLGTDQLGRDSLSRIIHGARTSLLVGLTTTALGVVVSTLIGGIFGVPWWQVGPGRAAICRRLDVVPGTAPAVDGDVHCRARCATDNPGTGDSRWHRRLESVERRRDRHQGECVFRV